MKILYVITRSDLGGAQVHLLDLLSNLPAWLHPLVAVGEEGYFADAVRRAGHPCHIVPNLVHPVSPSRDVRAVVDLVRLIRETKPDLVHTHTTKAGLLGRLSSRIAGVPSVFTAHTWCFAEGTSWKWRMMGAPSEWLAAHWCSGIINVSQANRERALQYKLPGHRQFVVHNGICDTRHRARPDSAGIPVISVVARCCAQKNHSLLLRALAGMQHPATVNIIGDGPTLPALQQEAHDLGVSEMVQFLGRRLDVAELLATSHVFALPTNWEGFPLSILEAMRAGLPVVASDVGGVSEAIRDGETGFLTPCGDVDAFRLCLDQLVSDPLLRAAQGAAGRRRYEEEFTLQAMVQHTLEVYSRVLTGSEHLWGEAPTPHRAA